MKQALVEETLGFPSSLQHLDWVGGGHLHSQSRPCDQKILRKKWKTSAKNFTSKGKLDKHAGMYNVVEERAFALVEITFGQVIRQDADDAKKDRRRIFLDKYPPAELFKPNPSWKNLGFQLSWLRYTQNNVEWVLGTRVIPKFLSAPHNEDILLEPLIMNRETHFSNGTTMLVPGVLQDVQVKFCSAPFSLHFFGVENSSFNVIGGCTPLKKLGACVDLGTPKMSLTFNETSFSIGLDQEVGKDEQLENSSDTDSEEFMSDSGETASDSEYESDNERTGTMLFERDPVDVMFSVMNGTMQPPQKACTGSLVDPNNLNAQSRDR